MSITTCPHCGVGRMLQVQTTYIQIYEGTLVHAPNVLAWKCDVCGQTFFDPEAIRRVEVLIGEAGPPPNLHAPATSATPARADEQAASPESAPPLDEAPGSHPRSE